MNTQDNVMPIEEAKALKEASDAIGKVIADLEKNDSGLDKGRIRNSTRNLARIIENARLLLGFSAHYDEFLLETVLLSDKGRRPLDADAVTDVMRMLTDHEFRPYAKPKSSMYSIIQEPDRERLKHVIKAVARLNAIDSLRDWFCSLPEWDGVERVDRFFGHYVPCNDNPVYMAAVSRYFLTSLAGRAVCPGLKADAIPVLYGPQGTRKSTMLEAIAPDFNWYANTEIDGENKEVVRQRIGKMIVEYAEMDKMRPSDVQKIRRDLALRKDENRRMKQDYYDQVPRRWMGCGTVNSQKFLVDETGNRRFFPLTVTDKCLIDKFTSDREQVFAEALNIFNAEGNVPSWLTAEELAKAAHEDYIDHDPWHGTIEMLLQSHPSQISNRLLNEAVGLDVGRRDKKSAHRIRAIMTMLGWSEAKSIGPSKERGFRRNLP